MSKKDELERQVQEKLAQCRGLLDECVKLAEEGGFTFSFSSPGRTYYPTTLFNDDVVLEHLRENITDYGFKDYQDFLDSPDDVRETAIEETRQQLKYDEVPEYTELGEWWMPSRYC